MGILAGAHFSFSLVVSIWDTESLNWSFIRGKIVLAVWIFLPLHQGWWMKVGVTRKAGADYWSIVQSPHSPWNMDEFLALRDRERRNDTNSDQAIEFPSPQNQKQNLKWLPVFAFASKIVWTCLVGKHRDFSYTSYWSLMLLLAVLLPLVWHTLFCSVICLCTVPTRHTVSLAWLGLVDRC